MSEDEHGIKFKDVKQIANKIENEYEDFIKELRHFASGGNNKPEMIFILKEDGKLFLDFSRYGGKICFEGTDRENEVDNYKSHDSVKWYASWQSEHKISIEIILFVRMKLLEYRYDILRAIYQKTEKNKQSILSKAKEEADILSKMQDELKEKYTAEVIASELKPDPNITVEGL